MSAAQTATESLQEKGYNEWKGKKFKKPVKKVLQQNDKVFNNRSIACFCAL